MAASDCHDPLAKTSAGLALAVGMTAFSWDLVGFDLDGTLLDTSGDLAAAVNHALALDGRSTLTVDEIKPMIGGGARHMLAQGMTKTGGCDDATLDRLTRVLLDYYEAHISVHTRPFPYAVEALDTIVAAGARVAIVTNKIERFARRVLDELGLLDRFACVIGGDSLGEGHGKPKPDLILEMMDRAGTRRAAFVGDSIYDVRAAHAAGLPVVACSFGFLQQPVETLGADAVIDDYRELMPVLERLTSR